MIHRLKSQQNGFTIIEVILFLAISGLMMGGLLYAVSGGINSERYRDATNSFTDFMKGQYNQVDNVQNARDSTTSALSNCDSASFVGADTKCTIIGRYISTDSEGRSITSRPVLARGDIEEILADSTVDSANDAEVYGAMGLFVPDVAALSDEYSMRWQTQLVRPGNNQVSAQKQTFRMVLLRSPVSSTISTYVDTNFTETPGVMNVVNNSNTPATYLCVHPHGLSSYRQKTGVKIDPDGVNSSSVQFATAKECQDG